MATIQTRNQILSKGMLRPRHEEFLPVTMGRYAIALELEQEMQEVQGLYNGFNLTGVRWVLCTRPINDLELQFALDSDQRIKELIKLYDDFFHVSDVQDFQDYWDSEMIHYEAAITVHKPDSQLGKPDQEPESTPII